MTIIANYYPFQDPAGGPNYFRFDPTVRYELKVDSDGDAVEDVTYRFRFSTTVGNGNTFLYNTGQVTWPNDPDLNVKQTYTVTRVTSSGSTQLAPGATLRVPPANIGPRSNPVYDALQGVYDLGGGRKVFGPTGRPVLRRPGLDLRPRRAAPVQRGTPDPAREAGRRGRRSQLQRVLDRAPGAQDRLVPAPMADGTIGVYASASRQAVRVLNGDGTVGTSGDWVQVSRLGNPLVNEVVIPIGQSDRWNASDPADDAQFLGRYTSPELAGLVNLLYPGLPDTPTAGRNDLVAVLLTGVPGLNFTGDTKADLLRLNTGIAPAKKPDPLGALAGDLQGFPNGRRLADDVTDIEIRAVACGYGQILAGALGLCNFTPNDTLADGVDKNRGNFLSTFPYVAPPNQGYEHTGHR